MKRNRLRLRSSFVLLAISLLLGGCEKSDLHPASDGGAGFRVRSDFAAPLNADHGWAAAMNENVVVAADQPFRIRFEVEQAAAATAQRFHLQYRRNNGGWMMLEAHDFPHPEREITVDFNAKEVGSEPQGWSDDGADPAGMVVVESDQQYVLRAKAADKPLMARFNAPWQVTEVSAQFRLADEVHSVAFVVGDVNAEDHCLVQIDSVAQMIRVIQISESGKQVLGEKHVAVPAEQWLQIEINVDAAEREIAVNFEDDLLEMAVKVAGELSGSPLGIQVAPHGTVDFQRFTFAGEAKTPRVSIVACSAYEQGSATQDLLNGLKAPFQVGTGINLADETPEWQGVNRHGEFEWPLVIRRFADGAVTNDQDDLFEFRMVDGNGKIVNLGDNPLLRLSIPPGHVGGTFIENPGRIGPWQASNGDLYFMMEPAETDNVFMMIKSTDNGRSWHEVDGEHRPRTDDLESVDSRQVGDTIHILHQVTRSARYHAFRTSDHPTRPDTWAVCDELAGAATAIAQTASMVVRRDGSVVAFYLGQEKIHFSVRSAQGGWSAMRTLDGARQPNQAGPQAVLGKDDAVHLAYYGTDGTLWYRRLLANGTVTSRRLIASGAGTSRAEYGAVLPLLYLPQRDEVVIVYRLATGQLWERRVVHGELAPAARKITDMPVVTDVVDSQQAGADVVAHGDTLHVLLIDKASRSIWSTYEDNGWHTPTLQVENILGSWVRGNVYTRKDGVTVYGYVYDAGSDGGAGMNRFNALELKGR